ncbi:HAD-IA family hydrolase [Candidatus Dojkabacteria bacterium]|nr:HAD-IA family hydrolase [Candidatus Dojkabacteria bacterium]
MDISKYKAIFFDFDGTLSPGPLGGYIPKAVLQSNFKLNNAQIQKAKLFEKENIKNYFFYSKENVIKDIEEEKKVHQKFYTEMAKFIQIKDLGQFVNFMVDRRLTQEFELYPDVKSILENIGGKYSLGIITEGLPSRIQECRRLGFYNIFETVLNSHTLGISKSDPEIYVLALQRFGMNPEESVLIDDSVIFLKIAKEVGLFTIYLDRKQQQDSLEFQTISSLKELQF